MPRNSAVQARVRLHLLSCAFALGCASAPPRQQSLDEAFARIQIAEARIEHARAELARGDQPAARHGEVAAPPSDCARGEQASAAARDAQRALCATAREIADADALIRCERAERNAGSIALQVQRRCAMERDARGAASARTTTEGP